MHSEANAKGFKSRRQDSTVFIFWMMMAGHLLAYLSVCLVTQPNLPLDAVEMIFWGQQWQLGYHKHPPLPAWIAATVWNIGSGHSWLIYLVSQLTIVATFWAVWQFAREQLSPWAALCSVAVLEGCYYCSFLVNDINNTIVTRPFWALTVLFLYRAMVRKSPHVRNGYWVLTGIVIGLGMISKYYMGVLVVAMLGLPLLVSESRKHFKTIGPYITTLVATLIFLPHAIWMFENEFATLQYVFQRSNETVNHSWTNHIASPIEFLLRQLPAVIPVLVLATPLLLNGQKRKVSSEAIAASDFFTRYLLVVFVGPILIYVLLGLFTGSQIRSMWGGPLFSFLGAVLFTLFALPSDQKKVQKIFRDSLCFGLVMVTVLAARNVFGPTLRDKLSRVHFPGSELAQVVNAKWNQRYSYPLPAVGGRLFTAGCVGVYSKNHVDVFGSMSESASPWIDDQQMQQSGGVIVWEKGSDDGELRESWLSRFEQVETLDVVRLSDQSFFDFDPVEFGIAVVHPTSVEFSSLKRQSHDRTAKSNVAPSR